MSKHTFTLWLQNQLTSARCALLVVYEQRDKLMYIDGPQLERDYMKKIGAFEESVIREEMECELLEKKQMLIQTAINRHEPIDEAAIDAEIDKYRQQLLKEAEGNGEPKEFAELSDEQSEELQKIYRQIVNDFHPQMHPEMTEVQRNLFDKAQEAYRRRDLEALKLICDMLYGSQDDELLLQFLLEMIKQNNEVNNDETPAKDYGTDYALADIIYNCFVPTTEEATIKQEYLKYTQTTDEIINEIDMIRSKFPYTAAEMLADEKKIEEYRNELSLRMQNATKEKERRTNIIREMIEGVATHG